MTTELTRRELHAWKALELILRDRNILIGALLDGASPYDSAFVMADAMLAAGDRHRPPPQKCTHGTHSAAPANREKSQP